MIGVIFGKKGSGKTKHLLELANTKATTSRGSIVFIDDDDSYMMNLHSSIRFINAAMFEITSPRTLYGFLCGLSASDYDLEYIFIDGFLNFVQKPLEELAEFFSYIEKFTAAHHINIILSVSGSAETLPDFMKDMVLQIT